MIATKHPIIFSSPKRSLEGSSWITHTPFAFFLISILKPKVVVELGVYKGQSYAAFCQAVRTLKLNTRCYGIDTWKGDVHLGEYEEEIFQELNNYNLNEYGEFSELLRMTFDEALTNFKDGTIDLLHIDGCHTYNEAKNDFNLWRPKVSQHGVVIFHDTFIKDQDFGVWKLWGEISKKYPSYQFLHGCGLGVAAIGKKVNKDFIAFLHEANSNRFYSKLFNSLGQYAFSQAINKKLKEECADFKNEIENSPKWKSGSDLQELINFIAPGNGLRRKALRRTAQGGMKIFKNILRLSRKKEKELSPIPEFQYNYYMDTLQSLESMPLPNKNKVKNKCAIFVMVKNEDVFLPIWLNYYSRYFGGNDIYVFDHSSTDNSVQKCLKNFRFNVIRLDYPFSFDHVWFKFVADTVQKKLIGHYEYVVFTDIDEIILPDVNKYKGLDDYIQKLDKNYVRCNGYELIHMPDREKPYNKNKSVLSQRRFWYYTQWYNKTLISNQPLNWEIGFHEVKDLETKFDKDLMLIHLHKLDFKLCWKTSFERARLKWLQEDFINNRGWQNRITDIDEFKNYYEGWPDGIKIEEIPESIRKSNIF